LHTAKDTEIYKSVWRYVHSLFKQEGVNNVLWVWNPHDRSFPNFSWNHYLAYYPGDDVVDIVGMTGYNTGNYFSGETWREFQDIYTPLYQEYNNNFHKPLMITEFGANSFGGDKAAWVERMFQDISKFARIKVAIWWSGVDRDSEGNAARIYRLDENDRVIGAFREGFKDYRKK
jgi:beta-mannanase